jgi:carbamoyl-phosphate synthase large subunit
MKTVLLTAVGSASAHAALTSLRAAGYRVLGCDIYPKAWNVTSGEVDEFLNVPKATDAEDYAAALTEIVRREKVRYIVPLTDVEVDALCTRKEAFRKLGATVCCPDAGVAGLCRDKLRMARALEVAGVCEIIPTYAPAALPSDPAYPLVLKPIHGRSSEGKAVVRSRSELRLALAARDDYVIQPFVSGDVYTVDCARDDKGGFVALARRERLRTVNGLGTAVDLCPGHPLEAVCGRICEFLGLVGVVNAEFIVRGEKACFLEVNPRFSGGIGFSVLAGYDFPAAAILCHEGKPLPRPPAFKPMTMAQRYEMKITGEPTEETK